MLKFGKGISLAALALFALTVSSFTSQLSAQNMTSQLASESVIEIIKKRGAMRVGVATFVPWSFVGKSGDLIGFEIDVAKKVAKDSGWKLELVQTKFDGIIPGLLAAKFDTVITGMGLTPKRNQTINFTIPYEWYGPGIVANKKLAAGWKTFEDANKPDVIFSMRRGTFYTDTLREVFPKAQYVFFDDDSEVFQEIINGKAHATITVEPKPTFYAIGNPETLYQPWKGFSPIPSTASGFALRKGDPDAINYFNNWIIQRQKDGWLQSRFDYWFATDGWFGDIENNPFLPKK